MKVIDRYNQRRKLLHAEKKSLDTFFPDFFDMSVEQRIAHILEQESVDYLIKLRKELNEEEGLRRKTYYETQIYRRIYDLIK